MNLPAVYYSAELDVCVIFRVELLRIHIEWEWTDLVAAQRHFGDLEADPFERGNFEYIGEL